MVTYVRGDCPDRGRCVFEAAVRIAAYARDAVRRHRAPRWPQGHRRDRHLELQLDRASAGRGDARACALRRRLAYRLREVAARDLGSAAPAGHRPAADDRPRSGGGGRDLRRPDHVGGRHPRGRPGTDGRRPRPGGRHRAAGPGSDPPGAEHRERVERWDLRPPALRGRCGGRRRIAHLARAQPERAPARGDRLRHRGWGPRRASDRSSRRICRAEGV